MTRTQRMLIATTATLPLLLTGCEIGPKSSKQMGYRGTAMAQINNPSLVKAQVPIPANAYETPNASGPRAREQYQNVPVLGDISADQFNHLMANINNWVVPAQGLPVSEQGCNYCHNPNNMASDEKYTKIVARRMIQMTQAINANYKSHVQQTGVTCWTCHRGNAVPAYKWAAAAAGRPRGMAQSDTGQNRPVQSTAYASLPYDSFSAYLKDGGVNNIRVGNPQIYPAMDHNVSTKDAEKTYGLMMHMSQGLGVNCTYCHNSNNFASWKYSTTQRVSAWHGLRMVATSNAEYITPLTGVIPAVNSAVGPDQYRKGPQGDPYKINCATCHQGLAKPMNGVSMRADHPTLWLTPAGTGLPAAPARAAPAAVVPVAMLQRQGG